MPKNTINKSKSWLKGVLSGPDLEGQEEKNETFWDEVVIEQEDSVENNETTDFQSNKSIHLKDNFKETPDKLSQDLINALENILKDRQLTTYKNKDLQEKVYTKSETINRLKYDLTKKDQLLSDKQQEISALESNLTNKQMSYDQLLEDYKDFQYSSSNELEKITAQLEKATNKYNKLSEETTKEQYQTMLVVKELEEKVRNLEVENQKLVEQYEKVQAEKSELMRTINDFTEKMSFSFLPKTTTSNGRQE